VQSRASDASSKPPFKPTPRPPTADSPALSVRFQFDSTVVNRQVPVLQHTRRVQTSPGMSRSVKHTAYTRKEENEDHDSTSANANLMDGTLVVAPPASYGKRQPPPQMQRRPQTERSTVRKLKRVPDRHNIYEACTRHSHPEWRSNTPSHLTITRFIIRFISVDYLPRGVLPVDPISRRCLLATRVKHRIAR